jgi:hypothetical protein
MTGVRSCAIDADVIHGKKSPVLLNGAGALVETPMLTEKTA